MSVDHLSRLQEEIREITEPLVKHLRELEEEIKRNEREHTELVKARRQLRSVVKGIDPNLVEPLPQARNRKNGKPNTAGQVSEDRLLRFTAWLQENKEKINAQHGVHASGLMNGNSDIVFEGYDPSILGHQSQISKALVTLHERGVVRLDHKGNGGAKYFTVV